MTAEWIKWIEASINTYFDDNKGSLVFKTNDMADDATYFELRKDGPH